MGQSGCGVRARPRARMREGNEANVVVFLAWSIRLID
jgi:hypothetical protein